MLKQAKGEMNMIKVMIDPGHGPGNANRGPTGYYEHEGNWKIANYLKEVLESNGNQADLTRTSSEDPDLYTRGKKAQGYDLFISEHSNAFNGTARGVEAFYDFSKPYDEEFADEMAGSVAALMGNENRGAKTRVYTQNGVNYNYYGVIRAAATTDCKRIILIENGFHDNPVDEEFLKQDENLRKVAQVQANVIYEFLNETNDSVHWAEKHKQSLEEKGIPIYDTRYDEPMTRGEVFALLDRIVE